MTHQQHHERERLLLFTLAWDHGIVIGTSIWLLLQTKPELVLLILSESSSESAFFIENSVTMSSESAFFVEKAHTVLVPFHSHNSSFLILIILLTAIPVNLYSLINVSSTFLFGLLMVFNLLL